MIYLFYGEDRSKALSEAKVMLNGLLARKPDAAVVRLNSGEADIPQIEALVGTQGLFNSASVVFLDGVMADPKAKEFILDRLPHIADSANVFIFVEQKLDKASVGKFEKAAKKTKFFPKEESKKDFLFADGRKMGREFNIFALSDALANKDKAALFSLLHEALSRSVPAEEIAGTLFWQVRSIALALRCDNAKEADLKPFVYSKAKAASKNFTQEEIKKLSGGLVSLYHEAHFGKRDFELGLEKLVLTL